VPVPDSGPRVGMLSISQPMEATAHMQLLS